MILVTVDDFNVYFSVAQTPEKTALLQQYIDRYEAGFIKRVLGVTLGELFIADIQGLDSDSGSIEDRFQVILDPFMKQPCTNKIHESKGMKDLLCGLIFCEYISDRQISHAQSGVVVSDVETAKSVSPENAARFGEQKWNEALESVRAIQWWVGWEDLTNYPEFRGTYFRPRYSPLL